MPKPGEQSFPGFVFFRHVSLREITGKELQR